MPSTPQGSRGRRGQHGLWRGRSHHRGGWRRSPLCDWIDAMVRETSSGSRPSRTRLLRRAIVDRMTVKASIIETGHEIRERACRLGGAPLEAPPTTPKGICRMLGMPGWGEPRFGDAVTVSSPTSPRAGAKSGHVQRPITTGPAWCSPSPSAHVRITATRSGVAQRATSDLTPAPWPWSPRSRAMSAREREGCSRA